MVSAGVCAAGHVIVMVLDVSAAMHMPAAALLQGDQDGAGIRYIRCSREPVQARALLGRVTVRVLCNSHLVALLRAAKTRYLLALATAASSSTCWSSPPSASRRRTASAMEPSWPRSIFMVMPVALLPIASRSTCHVRTQRQVRQLPTMLLLTLFRSAICVLSLRDAHGG
jgi:hypothetical protein